MRTLRSEIPVTRAASLNAFVHWLDDAGMPHARELEQAGLPREPLPASAVLPVFPILHFTEVMAQREGVDDLGVRAALHQVAPPSPRVLRLAASPNGFVLLGAVRDLMGVYSSHVRGWLHETPRDVWFCMRGSTAADEPGARFAEQLRVASVVAVLRELLGASWRPREVHLECRGPVPPSFAEHLGASVIRTGMDLRGPGVSTGPPGETAGASESQGPRRARPGRSLRRPCGPRRLDGAPRGRSRQWGRPRLRIAAAIRRGPGNGGSDAAAKAPQRGTHALRPGGAGPGIRGPEAAAGCADTDSGGRPPGGLRQPVQLRPCLPETDGLDAERVSDVRGHLMISPVWGQGLFRTRHLPRSVAGRRVAPSPDSYDAWASQGGLPPGSCEPEFARRDGPARGARNHPVYGAAESREGGLRSLTRAATTWSSDAGG